MFQRVLPMSMAGPTVNASKSRNIAHKMVINVVFSNTRKVGLKWFLKEAFANYI